VQHREPALVEGMNRVAYGLVGTGQRPGKCGGRLALGTGEEDLAASYRKGGRGPATGLERSPLVRRERAYHYRCVQI
jgi:hypothetical protein